MKNSIPYILMLIVLFAGAIAVYMIEDDIEKDKTEITNHQIDSLKAEIKELRKVEHYGFVVGDTTLQVISKFRIENDPYKYLHIKRIKPGKNKYDFVLNEKTRIEIIIMKN